MQTHGHKPDKEIKKGLDYRSLFHFRVTVYILSASGLSLNFKHFDLRQGPTLQKYPLHLAEGLLQISDKTSGIEQQFFQAIDVELVPNGKSVKAQSLDAIAADFRVELAGDLPGAVEKSVNIFGPLASCAGTL